MKRAIFVLFVALLLSLLAAAQGASPSLPSYAVRGVEKGPGLQAFSVAAWAKAEKLTWGPEKARTTFRGLWADDGLWLRFDIEDPSPWHTMTKRDDHIWEEEVVEIFIDLDGTGKHYGEYEINPANVLCDLDMAQGWPEVRGDIRWDHQGLASAVQPRKASGSDPGGWTAILHLPWEGFRTLASVKEGRAAAPPKPGDVWRVNLYRIERPGGAAEPRKDAIFAAWSPTGKTTFHHPPAFGRFRFVPR
jgi:hypothetical protein